MITRYSCKEMTNIWTPENKFNAYLEIEILACEAWNKLGVIPTKDVVLIRKNAKFNIKRIDEIEKITHHDVIAFTRSVSESLGQEKQWIHYGLTSTDIVDTANAYLLKQANKILLNDLS
ncbi:MAG: adenylosuccinate lyase, partial [Mycoplasmataceae bacterium]|nr:adenylosuccinate lyase [Mycoplasmataceae bacterium]